MRYDYVEYDVHAVERMDERTISDDLVLLTLDQPAFRYRSRQRPGRWIAERVTPQGSALRVVYAERFDERGHGAIILTMYRISTTRMGKAYG